MKHPNPSKCQELGQMFLDLHKKYPKAKVRMTSTNWGCETPACHAGWYAYIMGNKRSFQYDFKDSANDMTKFLGLPKMNLEYWARNNPKLWGNDYGALMFYDSQAFGWFTWNLNLKKIGKHWQAVGKRIKEIV